jgi:cobalt/nickel transport system permease protein
MHLPDGFLDTRTIVATGALAAAGVGISLARFRAAANPRLVPLMGLSAAFLFAAQMVNFPIAGGTSGHLVGSALAAALLGPAAAVLVLCSVLVVQCLLFADGGILALGANILNMAVVAPIIAYAIYRATCRIIDGERGRVMAVAFAGWCSIVAAAIVCSGELAWAGVAPWQLVFPAMTNIHMLIGLAEGMISALVVAALIRARPDLLYPQDAGRAPTGRAATVGYSIIVAVVLLLFLAPFASPWPDGLESVAANLGFQSHGLTGSILPAPIPDYSVPGIGSAAAATIMAGAVGTAAVFLMAFLLSRILIPKGKAR